MADEAVVNKKWYASKTLWVNAIAAVALFVNNQYGFTISADIQVVILAAVNFILRSVTRTNITW